MDRLRGATRAPGERPAVSARVRTQGDEPMVLATWHSKAEHQVINRVSFTTLDFFHGVPNVCGLCNSNPPTFHYSFSDDENGGVEYLKGFCCGSCAIKLLDVLEQSDSHALARRTNLPS